MKEKKKIICQELEDRQEENGIVKTSHQFPMVGKQYILKNIFKFCIIA